DSSISKEAVMVDLGPPEPGAREAIPGLASALVGVPLSAGDHPVTFTIASEGVPKEIAGQTARLKVTVKEAREKQVPALDDEFAKDTGEAETLSELKQKLRARLLATDEQRAKEEMKGALMKELLKRNPFKVAPALVERRLDAMLQRTKLGMALQGIDVR